MSSPSLSPNPVEKSPVQNKPVIAPASKRNGAAMAKLAIGTIVIGLCLFVGLRYLADDWMSESTDDAFIDGHIVAVASKASGEVVESRVTENQEVKAGDLLVVLDTKPYEVKVNQKRAALESAEANARAFRSGFDLMHARMHTAEATRKQSEATAEASKSAYDIAEANWTRAQGMWTNAGNKVISAQDYDTFKAAMTTAKANWRADIEKVASDASKVAESQAELDTAQKLFEEAGAKVSQAQADLQGAELDLSYTKIVAPVDGRIARKAVEKGGYLQVGQNLLAIVRPEIWVTANFKETQTAKIRPGQPVQIKMDGMTDRVLRGHVDSLQSGSGSRFSLLPPENAVGNYVKVVQRVPVKIVFDDPLQAMQGLGPGMSVTPSVQVANRIASDAAIAAVAVVLALGAGALIWFALQRRAKTQAQP